MSEKVGEKYVINIQTIKTYLRFYIEDNFITAPSIFYKNKYFVDDDLLKLKLAELRLQGYTSIDGLLSEEELKTISIKINKAFSGKTSDIDVNWSDKSKYWVTHNPLMLDSTLVKIALNSRCLAIAERYFGRKPYLADVDMRRILPADMNVIQQSGYSSSNWHRDTRGRQLKMMIYLTDVGINDSNFSFIPGSHISAFRRKLNYMASRFSDAEVVDAKINPIEWFGKAGSAMLFDTNLIHRLRRKSKARLRDSITFYYTPGQNTINLGLENITIPWESAANTEILGSPKWPFVRANRL